MSFEHHRASIRHLECMNVLVYASACESEYVRYSYRSGNNNCL